MVLVLFPGLFRSITYSSSTMPFCVEDHLRLYISPISLPVYLGLLLKAPFAIYILHSLLQLCTLSELFWLGTTLMKSMHDFVDPTFNNRVQCRAFSASNDCLISL